MDAEDWARILIILACLVGIIFVVVGCIKQQDENNQQAIQTCEYHGNILNTVSRYYNDECQMQSINGIWLPELDYLLLVASNCQQP